MLYMLALNISDVINFDYMEQPSLEVSNCHGCVVSTPQPRAGSYTLTMISLSSSAPPLILVHKRMFYIRMNL